VDLDTLVLLETFAVHPHLASALLDKFPLAVVLMINVLMDTLVLELIPTTTVVELKTPSLVI